MTVLVSVDKLFDRTTSSEGMTKQPLEEAKRNRGHRKKRKKEEDALSLKKARFQNPGRLQKSRDTGRVPPVTATTLKAFRPCQRIFHRPEGAQFQIPGLQQKSRDTDGVPPIPARTSTSKATTRPFQQTRIQTFPKFLNHVPPPSIIFPNPIPPPSRTPSRLLPLLLFLLLHNHVGLMTGAVGEVSGSDNEISVVEVVSGFNASLPCMIRIPANDAPLLTLWYQEETETPIYSYDQRTGVSGTSWADPRVFGGRAHYLAHLSPPVMLIMRVTIRDARLYRCRIDFHNSNSRVTWVRLKVIVPPERVEITPQISPVRLGQRDDVVCTAIGGNPPPSVVWLQNGVTVDPNSTVGQSGSFNRLEIPASRGDLKAPFTCQASNNKLTPPVFAVYVRNVTCGPTRILLEVSDNPLIVGRAAQITCKAFDSNPPARVTWYHQGKLIQKLIINVTTRGSETVSILHLQPGRHHHMRQLLCRAENPILPLETLEDIVTLNVAYRPHVRISLGWPRRLELLTEGSDLFLECIVDSNPPPYKIEFFQNGVALNPNTSRTTILKEATLAIQHVTREHSGDYQCKASNVQGDSTSKNISVQVRYVPICAVNESVVGAQLSETISLTCVVYAYPADVNFTWMFVSDARDEEGGGGSAVGGGGGGGGGSGGGGGGRIPRIIDALQYTCEGLSSTLHLTPKSLRDFGVFSCYGTNKNGIQPQPCAFALVPAGSREEPGNCSIAKVSSRQVTVVCQPGKFNGGRLQRFIHQVRLASTGELVLNKSSSEGSVELSSLEPDSQYIVSVTPIDPRGNGPAPRSFHIQTHREAKMHISLPSRPKPRKFLWIMGIGLGIVLTVVALLVGVWLARGRRSSHTLRNPDLDLNKTTNNAVIAGTGEARGINDGLCVNGLMHQTIYDSSGRYRGFAYMQQQQQQGENAGPGLAYSSVAAAASSHHQQQQEDQKQQQAAADSHHPPSFQSKLSLLKRDSVLTRGATKDAPTAVGASETSITTAENDAKAAAEDDGGGRKSGFVKWKWVVNHVTSGGESNNRFLDLCRLAQSKQLQDQSRNGESVL